MRTPEFSCELVELTEEKETAEYLQIHFAQI